MRFEHIKSGHLTNRTVSTLAVYLCRYVKLKLFLSGKWHGREG